MNWTARSASNWPATISRRADVTLMLCEGDLTDFEFQALRELCTAQRTVLLVLNKADRYTAAGARRAAAAPGGALRRPASADRIIAASAEPRPETVIRVDDNGRETKPCVSAHRISPC